jgi:hypothetical protein
LKTALTRNFDLYANSDELARAAELRAILREVRDRQAINPHDPQPDPRLADVQHRVVSISGWTCDICGVAVNDHQTDADGWPLIDTESVRHLGENQPATPAVARTASKKTRSAGAISSTGSVPTSASRCPTHLHRALHRAGLTGYHGGREHGRQRTERRGPFGRSPSGPAGYSGVGFAVWLAVLNGAFVSHATPAPPAEPGSDDVVSLGSWPGCPARRTTSRP